MTAVILHALAENRWMFSGLALGLASFIAQPDPRKAGLSIRRWRDGR